MPTINTAIAIYISREPIFNVSYKRNGGLRFVRIGRFQFSFCLVKG